jgi:hypothetical protein
MNTKSWYAILAVLVAVGGCVAPKPGVTRPAETHTANRLRGVPQPERYAALLEKARRGELREDHGEPAEVRQALFPLRVGPISSRAVQPSEIFHASYRAQAKTSFARATLERFADIEDLFGPLPSDNQMANDYPELLKRKDNLSPRIPLEKRNVKVAAWIYWVVPEGDHDFHVIIGNTPQLTSATVFMNSEVSGLPEANPSKTPFPQRRKDIRAILVNHPNESGLFNPPVPVDVTGSLLWDGEHRAPNNVGTAELKPKKAWEIHPIRELRER